MDERSERGLARNRNRDFVVLPVIAGEEDFECFRNQFAGDRIRLAQDLGVRDVIEGQGQNLIRGSAAYFNRSAFKPA